MSRLITSLPLIRRRCRESRADDLAFAARLKRIKITDEAVQSIADAVFAQIDCTTCASCCRSPQITVDRDDIERLAARVGVSAREFSRLYLIREGKNRYFASAPCPFLTEDNTCSVYEDRPQACRDFPYLHAKNFRRRVYVTLENAAACPIAYNVWQRLKTGYSRSF